MPETTEAQEHYSTYTDYNKNLRAWFVAFGVGGPALLLVTPDLVDSLAREHALTSVVVCFLIGVACQITIAFFNKVVSWYLYYGADNSEFKATRWYKIVDRISGWFVLDLLLDLITIVAFATAVIRVFLAIVFPESSNGNSS